MAQEILVPQVGQDLTEAVVIEIGVKVGDKVQKGDLVAVVESEKASFEVEAFAAGTVLKVNYGEGETAKVLSPLIVVGQEGEVVDEAPAPTAQVDDRDAEPPSAQDRGSPAQEAADARPGGSDGTQRSSPLARRIAAERGLDIGGISGSGPGGAVVLRDVEGAKAGTRAGSALSKGGLQIRTLQSGQGAPLVFLHGFGSDLSSWRPLIGGLGLDVPMLALDLPGHGAAAGVEAGGFDDLVDAVGEALSGVDGGLHLVGHSLGGAIAAAMTQRGDLDLRSMTLVAPAGLGPSIDGAFVEGFLAAGSEAALRRWMERLVHDPATMTPTLVRATFEARKAGGLTDAQARIARAVFERSTQLFSVREALAAFEGPATVVVGREDAIVSSREVEDAVPGHIALHRLRGVGHLPQVEMPRVLQRLIARTVRAAG